MGDNFRLVTVDASNVEQEGFFCYKSKPKSEGYRNKLSWMQARMAEGMQLRILYEGERSLGYVETVPGEAAWRVVNASGYLVIHCLWVVGKGKGKGYGARLIETAVEEARRQGKHGVVMVASRGNWLAKEDVFLKNGFDRVGTAPPSFSLLVRRLHDAPMPTFPDDWEARAAKFGSGATVLYANQCPYMPDAVSQAVDAFQARGIPTRTVEMEDAETTRRISPSPYGVFGIVWDGKLFAYHYVGKPELKRLDEALAAQ